jgi:hypothetical protein
MSKPLQHTTLHAEIDTFLFSPAQVFFLEKVIGVFSPST